MKRKFAIAAICLMTLILIISFKNIENEPKIYVIISHYDTSKEIYVSGSEGIYNVIKIENPAKFDRRPVLKIVKEYEEMGYKRVNLEVTGGYGSPLTTVTLEK